MIMVAGITHEEQSAVRQKMKEMTTKLARHEGRGYWTAGVYVGNYFPLTIASRKFIVAPTNVFKELIFTVLPEAVTRFPENFGKFSAKKVIEALNRVAEIPYNDFFKKDKCAYVFEVKNNVVIGEILRIELYRQIKPDKKNPERTEFVGGIFHGYKHFAFKCIPLSTQPSKNDISHPFDLIELIVEAFFITEKVPKNHQRYRKEGFETNGTYKDKYMLEAMFYYETISGTYFLDRIGIREQRNV